MPILPILYSYRRCPYAIRARLAIAISNATVQTIEVDLKAKPLHMLEISPKATVPVLELPDGRVIDESLDIMLWALQGHDPQGFLELFNEARVLIDRNDGEFKYALDRYKYPERYPEFTGQHYRAQAEPILADLNQRLEQHRYLSGDKAGIADLALLPFIRQFAQVDRGWFDTSAYPKLRAWLDAWTGSDLFVGVMRKIS